MSEIIDRFDRVRCNSPSAPLIHLPSSSGSLTAEDLWTAALEQRAKLERHGLGSDHLVISALGNRPEAFALWLACRSLGIALMPVDAGTTRAEIAMLTRRFCAACAIVPPAAVDPRDGAQCFVRGAALVRVDGVEPAPEIYRGAAVLKLTSGSTGLPKATFTTESQLVRDTEHIIEAMDLRPEDCQIAVIPLSHAYGLGNLLLPLLLQGTQVVLRDTFISHQLASDAGSYEARIFPGVPFMFDHLVGFPPAGGWPKPLQTVISAGARLEASTIRAFFELFGIKVHSFYGTTETGGITYDDSADIDLEPTVGRAMPGVMITMKPEYGAPADGGRIHVAGAAVAAGYAGAEGQQDGFIDGGFLTGDLGRFNDRQQLVLTGRTSSFINVAGRKVQPEEVECVLRSMPGILDVRVLGAPDPVRGEQIVACIVKRSNEPSALHIRQFCAKRLAPYKIPRAILPLSSIPLTDRGKTDRAHLDMLVREYLARTSATGVL